MKLDELQLDNKKLKEENNEVKNQKRELCNQVQEMEKTQLKYLTSDD